MRRTWLTLAIAVLAGLVALADARSNAELVRGRIVHGETDEALSPGLLATTVGLDLLVLFALGASIVYLGWFSTEPDSRPRFLNRRVLRGHRTWVVLGLVLVASVIVELPGGVLMLVLLGLLVWAASGLTSSYEQGGLAIVASAFGVR